MNKLSAAIIIGFFALVTARADDELSGSLELHVEGDRVWIHAENAPLVDVLEALDAQTAASLNFRNVGDEKVSVRYENISIDNLLARLGVNSVLVYTIDPKSKAASLEQGWGQSVPTGPIYKNSLLLPQQLDEMVKEAYRRYAGKSPYEVGFIYPCMYPVSVQIDGDLTDWPSNLPWHVVSGDLGSYHSTNGFDPADYPAVPPESDKDVSFKMASVADDDYLYVAMEVTDDIKNVDELDDDQMLFQDDSVEFYIDGGHERATSYDANDSQITIARTGDAEEPDHPRMSPWRGYGNGIPGSKTGTKAIVKDTKTGWTVEAAIPLSAFEVLPEDGTIIGWNVHVNDDDNGGARDHNIMWSLLEQVGGERAFHDPSAFGSLEIFDLNAPRNTLANPGHL